MNETRMDLQAHLPLKTRTFSVLTALVRRPLHGYALMSLLREEPGTKGIGPATLYRSLHELEASGLIQARAVGEAPRRGATFEVTALGRRVLQADLQRLEELTAQARSALGPDPRSR